MKSGGFSRAEVDLFHSNETAQCSLWFSLSHLWPLGIGDLAHVWPKACLFAY